MLASLNGFGAGERMEECIHFKELFRIVTGKRKVNNWKVGNHWFMYLLANWLLLLQSQRPSG